MMDVKNQDCFTLDGIVAEMVIEVEDCNKSILDEYRDLSPVAIKNNHTSDQNQENSICVVELNDNIHDQDTAFASEKENKENCEKVSETSDANKDDNADKSNSQITRRKRKREPVLEDVKDEKNLDSPRYPDRKRQANKKYISDDNVAVKVKKTETEQHKETPDGIKRRKLDTEIKDIKPKIDVDLKDTEKKANVEVRSAKKKSEQERHSGRTPRFGIELLKEPVEKPKEKKDVLRKLPFRKNRDAPDVPDLKPKIFWWNGVGEGHGIKLGDIPSIKERIKNSKSVRALFKVLFFQWPSNAENLIEQILKFNGFPFDETSYEFIKRQNMMKIMLDATIANICDILGLERDTKKNMIDNILKFLLKPWGTLDPAKDPSMQPVVLLQRIEIDSKFFTELNKDNQVRRGKSKSLTTKAKVVENTPVRTTRNSIAKMKDQESSIDVEKPSAKPKDSPKTPRTTKIKSVTKEAVSTPIKASAKLKNDSAAKNAKSLTSSKAVKPKIEDKSKPKEELEETEKSEDSNSRVESDISERLKKKIRKLKRKLKKSNSLNKIQMTQKKKPSAEMNEDKISEIEETEETSEPATNSLNTSKKEDGNHRVRFSLSDSSETESSEETKLVSTTQRKTFSKRVAKPLKNFPKIRESIQKANFSALQRLHILLFGASDKAENLKGNILAFGGFPFLEGSDDWKQKHFLLSLLAHNNLREYLNLLCIEYSDDDQPGMINKLMRFLACPSEILIENKPPEIETEVISSELINNAPTKQPVKENKAIKKKKAPPKKEEKKGPRHRKVLMSIEEARRLEANFAREQRALAREGRAPPPIQRTANVSPMAQAKPNTSAKSQGITSGQSPKASMPDPSQLNALLQTVYRRRALKAAGAIVSTPNKGERVKLGDIENVKFLIVTSNYQDLEYLHQLIFLFDASKSRVRKNILDFDGFGFNEDSVMYKERMDYLNSLGYDLSKRISFLLGLCPLQTNIPEQDLNELIMYFLMSPCKTKQVVPITQMPVDPGVRLSAEMNHLVLKPSSGSEKAAFYQNILKTSPPPASNQGNVSHLKQNSVKTKSPPALVLPQKAKKSISSSATKLSPLKKVILPPPGSPVLTTTPTTVSNFSPENPTQKVSVLNPTAVSSFNTFPSTTVLSSVGKVLSSNPRLTDPNSVLKVPFINTGTNLQVLTPSNVAVVDPPSRTPVQSATSTVSGTVVQNAVLLPQAANKITQPQKNILQTSQLAGRKLIKTSTGISPQEFIVQQQTPDGQQKTFKLIRLPPNHPLASAVAKPPVQEIISPPPIQQQPVFISSSTLSGGPQPSGFILMKNPNLHTPVQNVQNIVQTIPMKIQLPINKIVTTSCQPDVITSNTEEFVLPDNGQSVNETTNNPSSDPEIEILNPLEENPPTDDELFSSIQEIILSSNFEDITLRNVIERVSAQFPNHELTHRHNFMKECVKKIIIGTS